MSKFSPSQFVQHRNGGIYQILTIAKLEVNQQPVYVYRGQDMQTWVRPQSEMEDGRFTLLETYNVHQYP